MGRLQQWLLNGRNNKISRQLDYARSEFPIAPASGNASGFAACSTASGNLLLAVPSNKVFHLRQIYAIINDSIAAKINFNPGGSVASLAQTFLVWGGNPTASPGSQVQSGYAVFDKDFEGLFVYSASQATNLFCSMPATSAYIHVGGRLYDYSDVE